MLRAVLPAVALRPAAGAPRAEPAAGITLRPTPVVLDVVPRPRRVAA